MSGTHEHWPYGDLLSHVGRLERLAADLDALIQGQPPSAECLDAAPLLNPYSLTSARVSVLAGLVDHHPILGDDKFVLTSPLWVMASDCSWARTYSRFYRLGSSMADDSSFN